MRRSRWKKSIIRTRSRNSIFVLGFLRLRLILFDESTAKRNDKKQLAKLQTCLKFIVTILFLIFSQIFFCTQRVENFRVDAFLQETKGFPDTVSQHIFKFTHCKS